MGETEVRLKEDQKAEYELSVRYFHLKAALALIIIVTTCILYAAPLMGMPGVIVPETLNMLCSSILASFFFSKGTNEQTKKEMAPLRP